MGASSGFIACAFSSAARFFSAPAMSTCNRKRALQHRRGQRDARLGCSAAAHRHERRRIRRQRLGEIVGTGKEPTRCAMSVPIPAA